MELTQKKNKKRFFSFRKIIFVLLVVVFVWYIFSHRDELYKLTDALAQGSWLWLIVVGIIQVFYFLAYGLMTKFAFKTVQLHRKLRDIMPLVFGAIFVNVLAPTAGQSGTILFADDAARRKESSSKAIIADLIATITSYVAFSLILIFSIIYLHRVGLLNNYEIIGSIIFVFPTVLPGLLIFTSYKYPRVTLAVIKFIYRLILRVTKIIRRPSKLSSGWPNRIAGEFSEAATLVKQNKKKLTATFSIALVAHIINIASLFVIFLAFDYKLHYGALIAGYAFGEVARIISPQPEGIGVVEVVMAVIFTSFGVPPIQATAISIVFRGFNFWAPLGLGFLLLKKTKSFSGE